MADRMLERSVVAGLLSTVLIVPAAASADAVLDGTTGSTGSFSGDFEIPAAVGRQEGGNLFHSFERFSVLQGESATFTGPAGIDNVISRVTGGDVSTINGELASTIAGADFFFLNPAGVVFGPEASLNIDGSFHVSTADELRFADGTRFSANDPDASSFTVATPEAFGFLGADAGNIEVRESILELPAGQALSLIGGPIDIVGGPEGFVRAESGRVTLAAVDSAGEVEILSGEVRAEAAADIRLTDQAVIEVSGDGGGTVQIRGGRIVVGGNSTVRADNSGPTDATEGVRIKADAVTIDTGSRVTTDVFGSGAGGRLVVQADKLEVRRGSEISSSTSGDGHAGRVAVTADVLEVRDGGVISSGSRTFAKGNGGTVTVKAKRLLVSDGIESFTGITGQADDFSMGAGGTVKVHATRLLEIRDGGLINSSTFGSRNAGTVTVRAERLHIDGDGGSSGFSTGIDASADVSTTDGGQVVRSTGKAGTVKVRAGALEIRDGGEISSSTLGEGDAGSVTVRAERRLHIDGDGAEGITGISTSAARATAPNGQPVVGTGDGGSVKVVTAGALEIRDGEIGSFTSGEGDAGTVTVRAGSAEIVGPGGVFTFAAAGEAGGIILKATDTLRISGGGTINSRTFGSGEGGTVEVRADSVEIVGSAESIGPDEIETASFSVGEDAGKAGSIVLYAIDTLRMSDDAAISAETRRADAGDVEIRAGRLIDLEDSEITTSVAGGQGSGGNIFIDPQFAVLNSGRIVAQAREGAGGNIRIVADNFFTTPGTVIDASSDLGIDGTVEIDAPDVDLTSELAVLSTAFIDVSGLLRESCAARASDQTSSFVSGGRQGLTPDPAAPLAGTYAAGAAREASFQHWTSPKLSECHD